MKLRVEVDGESYELDLGTNGSESPYSLKGAKASSGTVSIAELTPGVFSLLIANKSFTVSVSEKEGLRAWLQVTAGKRFA